MAGKIWAMIQTELMLVSHYIIWANGTSILDQTESEVEQTQCNQHSIVNCSFPFVLIYQCDYFGFWFAYLPCVQLTSLESFFFCIWNWDVISLCCRGHGTYVDGEKLIASVAGIVERVNKLICVRPFKTRYVKCVLFFINLFTEMLISNAPESHLRGPRMPSFKSSHRVWDKFSGNSLIHSHVQILPWSRTSNPGLL